MSTRSLTPSRRCFLGASVGAAGALLSLRHLTTEPSAAAHAGQKPPGQGLFDKILARHQDMTHEQLLARLGKPRAYLERISFDPTKAAYFDRVNKHLELTKEELGLFRQSGFVSIDQNRRHTFASAYYQIYARDLPVLVTADSVMHALHKSYDEILMELETTLFSWTIDQILDDCHRRLAARAAANKDATLASSYRDVDLYLTVARNLLAGAGAPTAAGGADSRRQDVWNGRLLVGGRLGCDAEALARLTDVRSLKIQVPFQSPPTAIYGGSRFIDYSQFKPRGHYTKSTDLARYFRCLMWLGRADCGWNVLPPAPDSGVKSDSDRELRNAALLVELLRDTDSLKRLKAVDDIITFLIGRSDNLTPFVLADLLRQGNIKTLADTANAARLAALKKVIASGKHAQQMIRSQAIISRQGDPDKVPPPAAFQLFGQRFIIDSFVLAQVVYDSIVFRGKKQRRMMPTGLDVMAALGNDEAVGLLEAELKRWNYSANLMACREFVGLHTPAFWNANLYNRWLDCLRTLDDDLSGHKHFPEAMRTRAWQRKQLQAQLGSWAELRHDTILYAKQSYTAVPGCEYPAGYVEPYPEFYAKVRLLALEAGRLFRAADYGARDANRARQLAGIKAAQVAFFQTMARVLGSLEALAKKELNAEPFTEKEKAFLKKTVDMRGGGSGPPRYDGWYCDLFYRRSECSKWDPTVADVHTDPESNTCLEVGVGDVNLGVIAIDNGKDRMVFVGPLFSYYEFRQPVADRLTDPQWQRMIESDKLPRRPEWTRTFQAPRRRGTAPRR